MKLLRNVLISASLVLPAISVAQSTIEHNQPLITVVGQARLEVEPDQITIVMRAQASAKKQEDANKELSKEFNKFTDYLLDELHLDKKKVIAENLSIYPVYKYVENHEPEIVKYTASRNIKITLEDFALIDKVISKGLKSPLFTLSYTNYSLKDPASYASQVRKLAVEDSLTKAKDLANAYNAKVVKIHRIKYSQNYNLIQVRATNSPRMMNSKAMSNEDDAPNFFNPEKIELNDEIKAQFIIEANNLN